MKPCQSILVISGFSFTGATTAVIAPIPPAYLKLLLVHPTTYPISPLELSNKSPMNPYPKKTLFLSQLTMIFPHKQTKLHIVIKKLIRILLIAVHALSVPFNICIHTYFHTHFQIVTQFQNMQF